MTWRPRKRTAAYNYRRFREEVEDHATGATRIRSRTKSVITTEAVLHFTLNSLVVMGCPEDPRCNYKGDSNQIGEHVLYYHRRVRG